VASSTISLDQLRRAEEILERVIALRDDGPTYLPILRRVRTEIALRLDEEDEIEALRRKHRRAG
jgi:hypothetical protein